MRKCESVCSVSSGFISGIRLTRVAGHGHHFKKKYFIYLKLEKLTTTVVEIACQDTPRAAFSTKNAPHTLLLAQIGEFKRTLLRVDLSKTLKSQY